MGLSIYYEGKLDSPASLRSIIEEVKDVAEVHDWKYTIFGEVFPGNKFGKKFSDSVYGITYSPPKSEPICLCFTNKGELISPWLFEFEIKQGTKESDIVSGVATKTQYAGVRAHKIIIDLFRYLSEKYFKTFKLIDESEYWETQDKNVLRANFRKYNDLMDGFASALETTDQRRGESIEKYLLRVMEEFHSKGKKK